nr:OmpW family outer membrane protein [Aureimonas sp. Leaf454]
MVRGRIMGLFPLHEASDLGFIGGRIETPVQVLPDGEVTHFLTDHVSIELQGGVVASKPVIRDSIVGEIEIGTIWTAAVGAAAQYHFLPGARLNPYVGVGVNVSWPVRIEPGPGVADFDIDRLVAPALQAGADYQLSDSWFANTSLRYSFVPGHAYSSAGAKYLSDLDMLAVSAGFGYRF